MENPMSEKTVVDVNQSQLNLEHPDYTYKGILYSDGVTDQGIKVIPHSNDSLQSACNLFKMCLFRIEVQQNCMFNMRARKLLQLKEETEQRLKKMVSEQGSEMASNFEQQAQMKKEIERIVKDLEENKKRKKIQDENNRYE